ncbi:hypothetical protein [Isoptericola variabilis]|uniref:Uncharacterized protein n=1 Tax=Isoptericola variabilis (strain 225) TaxID=743718 RepID=F6FUV1_ISOV2|nr:hypothetical protein [Isoptericola variabilis]AEG43362.1 hypothetical protein Isova_0572 [Isoptericola variabilis 225]TWH34586.1 hypothetical protein L600_001100000680 [Isoptericola variabilis J7]
MHTMQNPSTSETEVVDLAEVADDIYEYELETARRAAGAAGEKPTPSTLTFDPHLSEFTD